MVERGRLKAPVDRRDGWRKRWLHWNYGMVIMVNGYHYHDVVVVEMIIICNPIRYFAVIRPRARPPAPAPARAINDVIILPRVRTYHT